MTFRFCPYCAAKLNPCQMGDEGLVPYCEKCLRPFMSYSHPCVIVMVVNELGEVALIRQQSVSTANFVCVAGYIKQSETVEECVKRKVYEELGLSVLRYEFVKSYYYDRRDLLMVGFISKVKKAKFRISVELDGANWFTVSEAQKALKVGSIAWQLLNDALEKDQLLYIN